ncbi:MAG: phosphoribosylformylglycinamidine synthase [Clostridia bacterium]|nr:phosphoribosylformylglycinamidine synthase [Clostridia bacterium]
MVYRLFVEKKPAYRQEAAAILNDLRSFLGIEALEEVRLVNRYDVEKIDGAVMAQCAYTVFSEPQVDDVFAQLDAEGYRVFATEYLPGQFDQRADSAAQCVQLVSQGDRPDVRTARVYLLKGDLTDEDMAAVKKHLMNPVESREASLEPVETLKMKTDLPTSVPVIEGFIDMDEAALAGVVKDYALAMDVADIRCCQDYFRGEGRNPTLTEVRMLDTYWSDHCRHTTFLTALDETAIDDPAVKEAFGRYLGVRTELGRGEKPLTLMDIATIGAKYLKKAGLLNDLDESEEINACTVRVDVDVAGETQKWLLLFKNETHNHPTEIEPFGGAATCIGGAIRDPLSGRGYVYQAMRVTGAADPTRPVGETIPGKLPQRKLTTTAAAGYSSYGNQIGLATGIVDEIYHDGYAAKRMEIGAVIGAAPAANVRREEPQPGDIVVLLGGRTGRDGCGGATGSSKSHNANSLETCGAEVQKGNAPEERKLQRLMRDPRATRLIKRCNDFGAGGVSVAIGELADGLSIDLNAVPRKYEGLDGTELAISESQERMAVVLAAEDAPAFIALAKGENLEATVVATVTAEKRLVMRWNGKEIVNVSRAFLASNGATKHAKAHVTAGEAYERPVPASFGAGIRDLAGDLNVCSKRGLAERFDSTIGAATVLMPFGGSRQRTPIQAMVAKLPVPGHDTTTCSAMSWGYNPFVTEKSPYRGAYLAVIESACKLAACGAGIENAHLTFQEYFERMGSAESWGKPLAALLGALDAQLGLGLGAIGGKDSMSGSFERMHVPPTLVSFAVSVAHVNDIASPEFKKAGSRVALFSPALNAYGLPDAQSVKALCEKVTALLRLGKAVSGWACGFGGVAEGVLKMALGNGIGFRFAEGFDLARAFALNYGGFILEMAEGCDEGETLGWTTEEESLSMAGDAAPLTELEAIWENRLEGVFPSRARGSKLLIVPVTYDKGVTKRKKGEPIARPRVLIPVFPGTNCEYDTESAFRKSGAEPTVMVINNTTASGVQQSVERFAKLLDESQILFIPGGFSGGDEPDGSGKFITAFLRNPLLTEKVMALLDKRDGLIGGICNGFQALIKLGLVPYGCIVEPSAECPTLTYNIIGRHQSRLVRTRVCSNLSPWMMHLPVCEVTTVPVSHGEGRFIATPELFKALAQNGQIATQYCDEIGISSMDVDINPNGSVEAVEGVTSPDGRVFGRMAHSERAGEGLYKNVPGRDSFAMFRGAVDYFR